MTPPRLRAAFGFRTKTKGKIERPLRCLLVRCRRYPISGTPASVPVAMNGLIRFGPNCPHFGGEIAHAL